MDFLRNVLSEVKAKKIDKTEAMRLIQQYQRQPGAPREPRSQEPKRTECVQSVAVFRTEDTVTSMPIESHMLVAKIKHMLVSTMATLLKVGEDEIDGDAQLSEYGFDSVSLTELGMKLNRDFGLELTPTVFFEYTTLDSFSQYLADAHGPSMAQRLAGHASDAEPVPVPDSSPEAAPVLPFGTFLTQQVRVAHSTAQELASDAHRTNRFAAPERAVTNLQSAEEDIAVIGMHGRFPMAEDLKAFWRNLREGRDCITEIPQDRWDWRDYLGDPKTQVNKTNSKWGGFIDGVGEFDHQFFGISPKEAELMDPQQRLLMMFVWNAIEDAGYSAATLSGQDIAIFVGTANTGYSVLVSRASMVMEGYSSTGTVASVGPNRMSFMLNLHGPSEPIETACSSSLVAIHRGLQAIRSGDCSMAIVGGINTLIVPEGYITFSKAGMLSPDGKCKTFSAQADGYVRGEGAGMLVLKRRSDAERDGDHIYGLIKASAENHGGRSRSLTAPNPAAQVALLRTAHRKAGVDPRTVSYVEAHGTGTALGDPIEIQGLKGAFGDGGGKEAWCGLGSLKTNIGHLEMAAGVAGVIKVLLQLKHKYLVKSLHCEELNPYIDLNGSPFYVVNRAREWPTLKDEHGRELPRRAGVSSFGFGGVNAHVVLEEYVQSSIAGRPNQITGPVAVVLSAKNVERLKDRVTQLLEHIEQSGDLDLEDLAYTLQVGRDAMEERLGLVVETLPELVRLLKTVLSNDLAVVQASDSDRIYRGDVKRSKGVLARVMRDEDMQTVVGLWAAKRKFPQLLDLWVQGLVFDWNTLYGDRLRPKRISLPGYPFAKERHWVSHTSVQQAAAPVSEPAVVQRTPSRLKSCADTKVLDGQEFFLKDHVVQGQKVLPGVVHLEMAREAVLLALGEPDSTGVVLKNVAWLRPVVVGERPVELEIMLTAGHREGEVSFEICGEGIHSQGCVEIRPVGLSRSVTVDVAEVKARCDAEQLDAQTCYEAFEQAGLSYGPAHRAIHTLYVGRGEAVARLQLPAQIAGLDAYGLHPSLLDGALQATAGLLGLPGQEGADGLALPFALKELQMLAPCSETMWVVVRRGEGTTGSSSVQQLDIDVCDEFGNVCVRMLGFSVRMVSAPARKIQAGQGQMLLLAEQWLNRAVAPVATDIPDGKRVFVCDLGGAPPAQDVAAHLDGVPCVALQVEGSARAEHFEGHALQVFEQIKEMFKAKLTSSVRMQVVVCGEVPAEWARGLSGLLRSASWEQPKFKGQLLEVSGDISALKLAEWLRVEGTSQDAHVRYKDGERQVPELQELDIKPTGKKPWRDDGVYLITGGTGGLGFILAQEMANSAKRVHVLLSGRAALTDAIRTKLDVLVALGAKAHYLEMNVARREDVKRVMEHIRRDWGRLDGIVHSAGLVQDDRIVNKAGTTFVDVLRPKVTGVENLDELSRGFELDWFICFSSVSGLWGNAGQADYACANGFMDGYAQSRRERVSLGEGKGRTLSLNWPLWRDGGMKVSEVVEASMQLSTGMEALDRERGLAALYSAMSTDLAQVVVLWGQAGQMRRRLLGCDKAQSAQEAVHKDAIATTPTEGLRLVPKIKQMLMSEMATVLKVREEDIDGEVELSEYGFDSISLTEFGTILNRDYGLELTPTVFFEYTTLDSFSQYLADHHGPAMAKRLADRQPRPAFARPAEVQSTQPANVHNAGLRMLTLPGLDEPIPVALYYPTESEAREVQHGRFMLHVSVNAPAADHLRGLILVSHGVGASETVHHNLAQALAEQGYLVAAIQHPGDNWHDHSMTDSPTKYFTRPKQVTQVLDALLSDNEWAPKIPLNAIGAIGHSAGACTVLALMGGVSSLQRLTSQVQAIQEGGVGYAAVLGDGEIVSKLSGVQPREFEMLEPRISATILMAPICAFFEPESLRAIKIPTKVYVAEKDIVVNNQLNGHWLRNELKNAQFEEVPGAGHFSFIAPFHDAQESALSIARAGVGKPGDDPAGFDRAQFQQRLEGEVVDFFDRTWSSTEA